MATIFGIIILVSAVVAANICYLLWPVLPLAIYELAAGVILALTPIESTAFDLHPETFMLLVIAPLMFNDGQNTSFRELVHHLRPMLSMAISLAIVTVFLVGNGLHLTLGARFSLPLAFMLAAIVTPTDAVAVKSLAAPVAMPENVNQTLEYEALFNDASGLVLFGLATSTLTSGHFSFSQGLFTFLYVFLGGLAFGAVIGFLLIQLRITLMRTHVDIGTIVIPLNVMTPLVTYWLAEEVHLSGILAVVAAGVIHSIFYDQLRLTSAKVQISSTTIWSMIADLLNGLVFVLLGASLPTLLRRPSLTHLTNLFLIALGIYLTMTLIRYCWARFHLVDLHARPKNQGKDSLLVALAGVHGTITLAMAFSIPHLTGGPLQASRNDLILIAAMVILISLTVGTVTFPRLLPARDRGYSEADFQTQLKLAVHFAIDQLASAPGKPAEKAVVINHLTSQYLQVHKLNQAVVQRLLDQTHAIELQAVEELNWWGKLSTADADLYVNFLTRDLAANSVGGFPLLKSLTYRLQWWWRKRRVKKASPAQQASIHQAHQLIGQIYSQIAPRVTAFLNQVQTPANAHEVAMVRRRYLNRQQRFQRPGSLDATRIDTLFILAFQHEHTYIQQAASQGKLSPALANALNEQVSVDKLVAIQSGN